MLAHAPANDYRPFTQSSIDLKLIMCKTHALCYQRREAGAVIAAKAPRCGLS